MKETGSEDELLTDRVVMLSVVKTLVQRQRVDMEHIRRLDQRHAVTQRTRGRRRDSLSIEVCRRHKIGERYKHIRIEMPDEDNW